MRQDRVDCGHLHWLVPALLRAREAGEIVNLVRANGAEELFDGILASERDGMPDCGRQARSIGRTAPRLDMELISFRREKLGEIMGVLPASAGDQRPSGQGLLAARLLLDRITNSDRLARRHCRV